MLQLTPDRLAYESFRHGQGDDMAVLAIWRWHYLDNGTRPNVHPEGEQLNPYIHKLEAANRTRGRSHVLLDEQENLGAAVQDTFATIEGYRATTEGRSITHLMSTNTVSAALFELLTIKELQILDGRRSRVGSWAHGPFAEERQRRVRERVRRGQASYLMFHGRDGHSTGMAEFDAMYEQAWGWADNWKFQHRVEMLTDRVAAAEMKHLGHLSLAC